VGALRHEKVRNPGPQISHEQQALKFIAERGKTNVTELFAALTQLDPALNKQEMTEVVWRLVAENRIELEDLPISSTSFYAYIRLWERNAWFYTSMIISLATVLAVGVLPSEFPFVALRWGVGLAFVLFVPGYVAVQGLCERLDLDSIERLILSVGLSITLVMLLGLVLNFTPWGIRLTPVVLSLVLLTGGIAIITLARQYARDTRGAKNLR
jgi:hypothetical protein